MSAPVVSVVVPTFDRPDRLGRLVAALERQDLGRPFEVIVVDDGSPPSTAAELARLAAGTGLDLRIVRQEPNQGPGAARDRAWRQARSDLIAFTDDDCVPDPAWLRHLCDALATHEVVQGRTEPDPGGTWGPWSRTVVAREEDFYATCNVGYRRTVLETVDGFDLSFHKAGEDTDLALRAVEAGARAAFHAGALVHHDVHRSDYTAYLHEKWRWEAIPLVVRRHPGVRAKLHSRWFWRRSHPPTVSAVAGLVVAASRPGSVWRALVGAALLVPYVRHRLRVDPLPGIGPRRRVLLLPMALAADALEVGVLVAGSIRYRVLVL